MQEIKRGITLRDWLGLLLQFCALLAALAIGAGTVLMLLVAYGE